jgi:PAS domain S-box-containing protein
VNPKASVPAWQQFIDAISEYAVFMLDGHGMIRSWNKGAERMTGWKASETIGRHFSHYYPPADPVAHKHDTLLQIISLHGEHQESGYRMHKDGSRFFASSFFHVLRDGQLNITGFGVIARDIAGKSETEVRLFTSESRLYSLLETIIDGVITINGQGLIHSYNKACITLFGYEPHEVIGKNVSILMPDPYHSAHDSYIDNFKKTGKAKVIGIGREVIGKRKDGSTFPMELAVGETHAGEEYAFVGIIRDITERKEAERAREQLRQSQRMEAIGQLTGGIAHDFNNLLAIILGNLDFMHERLPAGDPLHEFIGPSIAAAEHGSELTQQLLAFGRKQTLMPQVISLNDLVFYFTTFIRHMLGERVETSYSLSADVWNVYVDSNQLQNALINLSVNARDAMPEGGKLMFETSNVTFDQHYIENHFDISAGDYVMLAISDTGTGMDANVMAKAFEPFFTTKEVGKGTGLGLSMVYGFVKQSNGHIKLYSEPGFGTSVKIYLPRAQQATQATEANRKMPQPIKADKSRLVLVVEDNADVLKITSAMIESIGYRALTASSGDEAMRIIRQRGDIELLISDVMLPGELNGPALAKQAVAHSPGLKVLFNSGYAEQALQSSGLLNENVHLISKPFRKMQLASKIAELLERNGTTPSIMASPPTASH